MKTHLNTLFITTEGSYLAKDGEAVLVKQDDTTALRVPIHMLESIVCLVPTSVSPYLMALSAERGVAITFLGAGGRFLARVEGRKSGNVLLRKDQFRAAEDSAHAVDLARAFVQAKIHNCRTLLTRALRDHADPSGTVGATAEALAGCLRRTSGAHDLDELRGIEGEAARHYFTAFPSLVLSDDERLRMVGRTRRPPRDRVNALLSFAYSLLASDLRSACESIGLDPQVGFLHADRPGRVSLALDLAEELRPVLADRVVLSLLNRQQITADGFDVEVGGAVRMNEDTRKTFLTQYQKRKDEEIRHPFLGDRITLGLVPLLQARLLARTLRGDLDGYPAFIWR